VQAPGAALFALKTAVNPPETATLPPATAPVEVQAPHVQPIEPIVSTPTDAPKKRGRPPRASEAAQAFALPGPNVTIAAPAASPIGGFVLPFLAPAADYRHVQVAPEAQEILTAEDVRTIVRCQVENSTDSINTRLELLVSALYVLLTRQNLDPTTIAQVTDALRGVR
jgi:hypothetical protein